MVLPIGDGHGKGKDLFKSKQLGKLDGATKCERVKKGNGEMVETVRNAAGEVMKVSVFMDRNGDGKYEASEATSVRYYNVGSRSQDYKEFRDLDGDGMADELVESDWTGNETIKKMGKNPQYPDGQDNDLMSMLYGGSWDSLPMGVMHLGRAKKQDGSFMFE